MRPYIELNWTTEAPVPASMGEGNICLLASGNAPSQSSNPQQITPSSYADYLSSSTYEYIAYGSYKNNVNGTPSNSVYVYWMGEGAGITGILEKSTDLTYFIGTPPFSAINSVQIDPTGGGNWQDIDAYTTTVTSGFMAQSGEIEGIYNGWINFSGSEDG